MDNQFHSLARDVRRVLLAIIALVGFTVAGSAATEPYSVEDAILHQRVNFVRFTPDGADVLVEYMNSVREGGASRPKFFWADLRGGGNSRTPLFHSERADAQGEGYARFSPSPDSHHVAYLHYRGDSLNLAVYDFHSLRSTEFDVVPDDIPYLTWISDHEVVFSTVSPGTSQSSFIGRMSLQWRKMQEGASTTASAMGSGRYAARPENSGGEGIVVADIGAGSIRLIAPGRFLDRVVSPDGARLAAIRRVPAILNPQLPITVAHERGAALERGSLLVFGLHQDRAKRGIGESPDAVPGSLRWSPSGRYLAFLTAKANGSGYQSQLWTYDAVEGATRPVELGRLSVSPAYDTTPGNRSRRTPAFAWLGEELTVLAQDASAPQSAARADWFLLRSGAAPINLTVRFSQVPEVAATTRESWLMSADGQVWELKANQPRRLLAGYLGKRVRIVPDRAALLEASTAAPISTLALEDESSQGPKTIYFLDVASGRVTGRLAAPAADAYISAISSASKQVAFTYRQDNVDIVAVSDAGGTSRDILRLNEFEKDREIGTFVKVDYTDPKNGRKLISWLLLPPGYRKGPPLPTVVDIYPGIAYGPTPPQLDPADRPLLVAAHGYAVLLASLPIDDSLLPREPLQGLADAVLLAVDAARSQGYVDGDHLAIQGHSYGGYGTLGVIGQTDRFKAAVAVAGDADLLSTYGQPRMYDRLAGEFDGILDIAVPMGWAETNQGGMGVPPWRDPQRYLRNSPLLHVDAINTPVMLVHGELDSTVPFSQSEEMFTALYRLNKDAVFVRYWGEGHHVPVSPANIRDYWVRVYDWYDTHIGPPFDVAGALSTSH